MIARRFELVIPSSHVQIMPIIALLGVDVARELDKLLLLHNLTLSFDFFLVEELELIFDRLPCAFLRVIILSPIL